MKKIFIMVMLLCSMCAVCLAKLEQPTDDRWVIVVQRDKEVEIWADIESVKYGTSTEIGHRGHKVAKAWTLLNFYDKGRSMIFLDEYDFECETNRMLSFAAYDSSGNCIHTNNKPNTTGNHIIPGSKGDDIFQLFKEMNRIKDDPEQYALFKDYMKFLTKTYKENNK